MTQIRLLGGRYQVGELLGYGGMAEVRRARDLRLGRDVAIKFLRNDLAGRPMFQSRFRQEAENTAALNHPAIVAVYDSGEDVAPTGYVVPFIVMEFVNGRTIKEMLEANGAVIPKRALEIAADVCAALEFSHRHGIIHRDIKPSNVMMTRNGQIKVMDFGTSRARSAGGGTVTTVYSSSPPWDGAYMAPEFARGESVDARSDVYSVGCLLFELLCGRPPFMGDYPGSVAAQHLREDPQAPSQVSRTVGRHIDAVVLMALAKNPANRYQSAEEMRTDVIHSIDGRPLKATPLREFFGAEFDAEDRPPESAVREVHAPRRVARLIRGIGGFKPTSHKAGLAPRVRLPKRSRSSAILVGTSSHAEATLDLPVVGRNLESLAELLSNRELGGFDSDRTHVLHNPSRAVTSDVAEFCGTATDTFLIYYSGHGVIGADGRLYLGLPQMKVGREIYTALPYDELRFAVLESPAQNKVIILDCCFSGRAIDMLSPTVETALSQVDITGSYVLTATSATRPAHAPKGERFSTFTGELIDYLNEGSADAGQLLRLHDIYRHLRERLSSRGLPLPQQRGVDTTGDLALVRNRKWRRSDI